MRNRLNIIINYTVNHLGLGLKGVFVFEADVF